MKKVTHLYSQPLYVVIRMLKSLFLFLKLACDLAYISRSCLPDLLVLDILFPKIPGVLLTEPFLSDSWNFSASLLEALWGASCSPRSGRFSAHETVVTGCYRYESGSSPLFSGVEVFCHIRVDSTGNYLLQIQTEERTYTGLLACPSTTATFTTKDHLKISPHFSTICFLVLSLIS